MTVHDFDMARFVTGSEVEEVYAFGDVRVDQAIGEAGDLDTTVVALRHADRTLTVIDNSRRSVYGYDQRVEAFRVRWDGGIREPTRAHGVVRTAVGTRSPALSHFFTERYMASYLAQWAAFERTVRAGDGPLVNGADGRAALVIGLAAGTSVRERRPVRTSEIG